ncbi:hypothetical protein Tco_1501065 [Tanacetum coccineum]
MLEADGAPKVDDLAKLENQVGVSSEHLSDTNVFTMKMEILLEPASNKLLVGIGVNAGDSKLMLLGINLLLLGKVNAARHNLLLLVIVDFLNASSIRYALTVNPTIYIACIEQFWATVKVKTVNREQQLQALMDGKKIIITKATLTLIGDEKLSQKLTFCKAFFSPQWKFLIRTILQCQSAKITAWNEFSGTMASAIICLATNQKFKFSKYIFESMSSVPSDPTNVADEAINEEPSMQLKELMDFCTKLQQRVLDLENTKTAQAQEITILKKRGRKIHDIDADEDITLENLHDAEMFGVNDLEGDEVVVESEVADKDVNFSVNEVTLAQALAALKSAKVKDKGKGKIVEKEPVKKMSKKELVKLDEELAFKLQAKEDEEERLTREKAQKVKEANIP